MRPLFLADRLIIFFVVACCFNGVYAQQSPLRGINGYVKDSTLSVPVAFANVILLDAQGNAAGYAATSADGSFSVNVPAAGTYNIEISFVGYLTKRLDGIAVAGAGAIIELGEIQLVQSDQAIDEVVVRGERRKVVYKLDRQVLDAAGFISASGGTAVDILSQTPSVNIDAEGELTFRGSSGFRVYIDGRPSSLRGTAALEQIPAGQIENIEVLTTPSARNDADGSAGIININTRKQKIEGVTGLVNLMGSTEKSRNVDFLLSQRKQDFLWQISGEASKRYVKSDFDQVKTIDGGDLVTTTHSTGDRTRHTEVYYLRTGFEWYRPGATWSAALQGGWRDRWRGGQLDYEDSYTIVSTGQTTYGSFVGSDFVHLYEYNLRADIGSEHRFPGREGHMLKTAVHAFYEGNAMENFQTDLWDLQGVRTQGHRAWEYEYRFTAQANADYVYPFAGEGKLEAGYQLYTYTEDGDYKTDVYDGALGDFVRRDDLYNEYLFRRDIHALYAQVSQTHGRFSYQAGLRGEYIYRKLGNNWEWAHHTKRKFDLFPSVHLGLETGEDAALRFSYARRITQPELWYLEPYVVYVDFYTAQRGNPFIKPEYTNSLELGYSKNFTDNSISATAFHRIRRDKIERVRIPYETGITLDSMANVGNDYASGLELAGLVKVSPVWNIDANGSFYYYRIKNEYKLDGRDENSWNWQLAVNNNFDVTAVTRLRLEAYYVGPMVSTQGRVEQFFYLNFTARQQFLKRRLAASLIVRDIFGTAKYRSTQTGPNLDSRTRINPTARMCTLSLSYNFNNFRPQRKSEKVSHDMFEGTNR